VTSATGDLVLGFAAHGDIISGSSQTNRWITAGNGNRTGGSNVAGDTAAGSASVSLSWSSGFSDHWSVIGVNISASGGASVAYDPAAQIIGQSKAIQTACQW
jgi:hypothetical protein